jgi:hypothetical protein
MTEIATAHRPHVAQAGPPLPIPIVASVALFAAGLISSAIAAGGMPYVTPAASDADLLAYVNGHHDAIRVWAFFLFGSSIPLAIFAATVSVRLQRLGIRAPGAVIALVGGILAAVGLALSAFFSTALAVPAVSTSLPLLRALHQLSFVTGGTGHVAGLGLLVAGIAVPALIVGLLPRWLSVAGLVVAVVCELSTLSILSYSLSPLLPMGRFPALVWLVAAAFLLPASRAAANQRAG